MRWFAVCRGEMGVCVRFSVLDRMKGLWGAMCDCMEWDFGGGEDVMGI